MPGKTVLLVNPNFMRPPIGPIGLEYVASSLRDEGFEPILADLPFMDNWREEIASLLADARPLAVGVSIRNIDDAYFAGQDFILERTLGIIEAIREQTEAPMVLGGIGFSAAPGEILDFMGVRYGIRGRGGESFGRLLKALPSGDGLAKIEGLVYRDETGTIRENPVSAIAPIRSEVPSRRLMDNPRYFREGGQAGIETKSGCGERCLYCIEPEARGFRSDLRAPNSVAMEMLDLLQQGVDVYHLCDSEFNLPPDHARAVCEELIRTGIASRARWYTYASPTPFDEDLARSMAAAGCVGINFGVDHGDPDMLRRLGRRHTPEDVRKAARLCRDAGITVMFDLLLGSPGETRETIARAIEVMREAAPDRVGLSCGVRVYPHTPLARTIRAQGPIRENPALHGTEDNENLLRPIFYVSPAIGEDIHRYVWSLAGGDNRFLTASPEEIERNYNYNDNTVLEEAIRNGARGAYWDVLRKIERGEA